MWYQLISRITELIMVEFKCYGKFLIKYYELFIVFGKKKN